MARKALSIKVNEIELDSLKQVARASGKSVTSVLMDGMKAHAQNLDLQAQLQEQARQIQELQARFQSATGRKIQTKKEARVPLTEAEHHALKVMAADRGTSMGLLLRQELEQGYLPDIRGDKPALEAIDR